MTSKYPCHNAIAAACRLHIALDMKKAVKKLHLDKRTIRVLATNDLPQAAGGWIRPPITWSCPQP